MEDWRRRLCPTHIYIDNYILDQYENNRTLSSSITAKKLNNKYQLINTKEDGDFLLSLENIKEGSLILEEKPYAFEVNDDTICPNCLQLLAYQSIPCRRQTNCSWHIYYCSYKCETEYWFRVHMFVCRIPELKSSPSSLLLAFQLWMRSLKYNNNNNQQQQRINNKLSSPIQNLVHHLRDHSKEQQQQYKEQAKWIASLFLIFSMYDHQKMEKDLIYYQAMIRCNGFGIQRKLIRHHHQQDDISKVTIDTIATGIYPTASKFNHSCQPNVLAFFHGSTLQLRSLYPISPNEPLFISYGPLAANMPTLKRQQFLLDHYFFTCHCQACQVINNPNLPPSAEHIYICTNCKYEKLKLENKICPLCNHAVDWIYLQKVEQEIKKYTKGGQLDKVLQLQKKIYRDLSLPIGNTYDQLAYQYHSLHQPLKAAQFSEKSLSVVQSIYGNSSPEAAEEMFKLCTILFSAAYDPRRLRYWIEKTRDLYKNLGLNHQLKEDIQELDSMLQMIP